MTDEEWIELASLETEEDWARLAEAFPDSFLAASWRLHVAWRELETELIEAFGSERIYRLLLRLGRGLNKLRGRSESE